MEKIEVALSKGKLIALSLGSLTFLAVGPFMIFAHYGSLTLKVLVTKAAGVAGSILFGAIAVFAVSKLFDGKPGLVIDENGIFDNSSAIATGFIPWEDVKGFREIRVRNQRFLIIEVVDPEKYISRSSYISRMFVLANSRFYGSPIAITSNAVSMKFDTLKVMVVQAFDLYRSKQ